MGVVAAIQSPTLKYPRHFWGTLKRQLGCRRFHGYEEVEMAVHEWMRNFKRNGNFKRLPRREKAWHFSKTQRNILYSNDYSPNCYNVGNITSLTSFV